MSVQQCKSVIDGPIVVEVPSHSSDRVYELIVTDPDNASSTICECNGYEYRGYCSHQREALDQLCGWTAIHGPETQSADQKERMICPRCWGETHWVMEAI